MRSMSKISVLLVDDHPAVRTGLSLLLKTQADMQVVGEAADGRQAIALAKAKRPAVVVMDLKLPLLDGVQATRRIHKEVPSARVLVLTTYDQDQYIRQAIAAGAFGFLLKQAASEEVIKAIREVHRGNPYFSAEPPCRLRGAGRAMSAGQSDAEGGSAKIVSLRQAQVLALMAEGFCDEEIAAELRMSLGTVKKQPRASVDPDSNEIPARPEEARSLAQAAR